MKRLLLIPMIVALLACVAGSARAQRPQGGRMGGFDRSGLFLLTRESVQKELNLTPEQVQQATELGEKGREAFRGLRDASREERHKKMEEVAAQNEAGLKQILKPEQLARLNQISLQQRRGWALTDAKVAEQLALTDEQKQRVRSLEQEARAAMRELGQQGREQAREKFESLRNSTSDKLEAVLTAEQQAKFKEMQGAPFQGEIRFGRPRRPQA